VRTVRTGVERAFGAGLRAAITRGTRNRLTAFGAGLGATVLLQSSTATALIVAAFAGNELIRAVPALAVMLGADVGSTLIAQVLTFDILWLSPILIAVGVGVYMASGGGRSQQIGRIALGLGLMLLALRLIIAASEPLRDSEALTRVLAPLVYEPLLAVVVAAFLTWLAHSSLAVVLLVMSLAAAGAMPLLLALYLVIGANIGGACAPVVMTLHAPRAARRLPLGNLLMRAAAGLVLLPFVDTLAAYLPLAGADPARQVVNFHTGFNLALAAAFILLTGPIARLLTKLLPDRPVELDPGRPRHLDRSTLDAAMSGCRCVFHLAAQVSVAESVADPRECMRINVDGTQSVLEAAMHAGVSRVICATSAAAYGESPNLPSREVDPICCCSPYAVSKVACECLMQAYARCYGLSTISLRLFNIYGPRQDPKSPYAAVISAFTDALINGWHPKVFGDGKQTRDFTYVDNAVYAFALAAMTRRELQGEVVNIGCGRRISLLEALDAMSRALEVTLTPHFDAPRNGDVRHSQADITLARRLLGYTPIVQFEEGIERTMRAVQERSLRPEPT
jgi:Na/Pi-cotransporter